MKTSENIQLTEEDCNMLIHATSNPAVANDALVKAFEKYKSLVGCATSIPPNISQEHKEALQQIISNMTIGTNRGILYRPCDLPKGKSIMDCIIKETE